MALVFCGCDTYERFECPLHLTHTTILNQKLQLKQEPALHYEISLLISVFHFARHIHNDIAVFLFLWFYNVSISTLSLLVISPFRIESLSPNGVHSIPKSQNGNSLHGSGAFSFKHYPKLFSVCGFVSVDAAALVQHVCNTRHSVIITRSLSSLTFIQIPFFKFCRFSSLHPAQRWNFAINFKYSY